MLTNVGLIIASISHYPGILGVVVKDKTEVHIS